MPRTDLSKHIEALGDVHEALVCFHESILGCTRHGSVQFSHLKGFVYWDGYQGQEDSASLADSRYHLALVTWMIGTKQWNLA